MANRVLLGEFQGTYVLRVSRPGYNVLDPYLPATGLVFDSRWATFAAVHLHGSVGFQNNFGQYAGDNAIMQAVYHGLGYVPFVLAWPLTWPGGQQAPAISPTTFQVRADAYYIYISDLDGFGGTCKYVVLRTRAHG